MINLLYILLFIFLIFLLLYFRNILLISRIPAKLEKARALLKLNPDRGAAILTAILNIDKSNPVANWLLANLHLKKHRFILSLMFFHDIIKYNRYNDEVNEKDVRLKIAQVYLILGNIDKALTQYSILSRDKKLPLNEYTKAVQLQIEHGKFSGASKMLDQAFIYYPNEGLLYYLRGVLNYNLHKFHKAKADLIKAQENYYMDPDCLILLGKLFFIDKDYNKALEQFGRIPHGYLDSTELENLTAQTYYYLSDHQSAINILEKTLERAKEEDPYKNDIKYFLACSYEITGDIENAINLWKNISTDYHYYSEAKEKIDFYENDASEDSIREFLTNDFNAFKLISDALIAELYFSILEVPFTDTKNIHYICKNKQDMYLFNKHLVAVNRNTIKIDEDFLRNLIKKKVAHKCQSLTVIAPSFKEETANYAEVKNITLYNIDIFKKTKLLS